MIGIDANDKDGGGRREDIPVNFSPSFLLLLISLFFFIFSLLFSFFKDTSRFQKNLHEIRVWRSFWF